MKIIRANKKYGYIPLSAYYVSNITYALWLMSIIKREILFFITFLFIFFILISVCLLYIYYLILFIAVLFPREDC